MERIPDFVARIASDNDPPYLLSRSGFVLANPTHVPKNLAHDRVIATPLFQFNDDPATIPTVASKDIDLSDPSAELNRLLPVFRVNVERLRKRRVFPI